jgi:hypothetical protein
LVVCIDLDGLVRGWECGSILKGHGNAFELTVVDEHAAANVLQLRADF